MIISFTKLKKNRLEITDHSLYHDNLRPQIAADKVHSEQTQWKDDEIDAVQYAGCLPSDLEKPQYKTYDGDCISACVHYVNGSVKMQFQLTPDGVGFLLYDLTK